MKLTDYLTNYVDSHANLRKPRTIEAERRYIRLYIHPICGEVQCSFLRRSQLSAVFSQFVDNGHSRTAEAVYVFLRSAFASNRHLSSILASIQRPKHIQKPIQYWSCADVRRFLAHCSPHWRPVWVLMVVYGLRRGEVCGLRWQDIDIHNRIIHIRNQRQYLDGVGVTDLPPKSLSSVRDLPLLPIVESVLEPLFVVFDAGLERCEYVFPGKNGNGLHPSSCDHALREECRALGLPKITVHGLRHTMAALSVSNHQSLRILQSVLGHSSITTTSKVYAHVDLQPSADLLAETASSWLYAQ